MPRTPAVGTSRPPATPRTGDNRDHAGTDAFRSAGPRAARASDARRSLDQLHVPYVHVDILAVVVWEFAINRAWATGARALMATPIPMVPLSTTLSARSSRTVNLIVATGYILISVGNAVGEAWT